MSVAFDTYHFAEGRFRLAYKGTYTSPAYKVGQQCVVKKNKSSYVWEPTDLDMSLAIQEEASALAGKFNQVLSHARSTNAISFTNVVRYQVTRSAGTPRGPRLNEYVLVEDYIPGNFTKWCNNYGYISSSSELMPAFMHWSWAHTGGQKMVADLQGVLSGTKYTLTDPVLLSNSRDGNQYGCTDMGVEGMAMFFLNHTCSQFCSKYPKPQPRDVVASPDALWQLKEIKAATAYAHELKFPVDTRNRLTTVFPRVATRGY